MVFTALSCAPAALPQTLTVTPNSLSFTYVSKSGNIPPNQTVMVTSSAGATTIGISANPLPTKPPTPQFAAIVPPSGMGAGATTPVTLTVKLAPASILDPLSPGTYTISFSIFGPAGTNTPQITVTLIVTSAAPPPAQTIAVSPNAASLVAPVCPAPAPASRTGPTPESGHATFVVPCLEDSTTFTVSEAIGQTASSFSAASSNPAVNLSATSGTVSPGIGTVVTATLNPAGLSVGNQSAVLTFTPNTGAKVTVPITFTITDKTILKPSPTSLIFTIPADGTPPAPQTIQISQEGPSVPVTVTALDLPTGGCLKNSISTAFDGIDIEVGLNPNVTFVAPCFTGIGISAPGAQNSGSTVSVQINVLNKPHLDYSKPWIASYSADNLVQLPGPYSIPFATLITNTGTKDEIDVSVVSAPSWATATLDRTTTSSLLRIDKSPAAASLPPGTYSGVVVIKSSQADNMLQIPVTLTVNGPQLVLILPSALSFTNQVGGSPQTQQLTVFGPSGTYSVSSSSNLIGIPVSTVDVPDSGAATLDITASPSATPGTDTGVVSFFATGSSLPAATFPVTLRTTTSPTVGVRSSTPTGRSYLTFIFSSSAPIAGSLSVNTADGSNCATLFSPPAVNFPGGTTPASAVIQFNPAFPGACLGTLNVTDTTGKPLSTTVFTGSSALGGQFQSAIPLYQASGIFATHLAGQAHASATTSVPSQTINLAAPDGSSQPFAAIAPDWLTVTPTSGTTPATITIAGNSSVVSSLGPGSYVGTVTVVGSGNPNPLLIPVNLVIGTAPAVAVVNAASGKSDAVSPGEIVSIFGTNIGPATGAGLTLTSTGAVATTLGNTQVLFDGVAASLTYAGSGQINAIVPYETAGRRFTNVTIQNNGATVGQTVLAVIDSDPAIFSLAGGSGQGAILNQDSKVNGSSNPAAAGSIIVVYATGEGMLTPAAATGSVTSSTGPMFPAPVLPVSVTIGGQAASIIYAGEAPGFASGVFQLDVTIPPGVRSGAQPVVVKVGDFSNAAQNITVAVQ